MDSKNVKVQGNNLYLSRCPHCSIATPNLVLVVRAEIEASLRAKVLRLFGCQSCGGGIVVESLMMAENIIVNIYPSSETVDDSVTESPRRYLNQALESLHAPDAAVMMAASAVDAMLKEKGYKAGSLFARIDQARDAHLITQEMSTWAHEIRLDANEQRHADEHSAPATREDAERCIEFARALAQYLFVLPSRVNHGRTPKDKGAPA